MEHSDTIFDLLDGPHPDSVQSRETDVVVAEGKVSHAVDQAGKRMLLVPVGPSESIPDDLDSKGVSLERRELVDKGVTRTFALLRCELASVHAPFNVLCDEAIADLAADPSHPARTLQRILDRWRELLGPRRSQLLGENALAGLLAELHFLAALIRVSTSAATALHLWTGPDKARSDFTGEHAVAEVKATTRRDSMIVEIHGLKQLLAPERKDLFIWVEQLERVPVGGESLPDLIDVLNSLGVPVHDLLTKLLASGYRAADADSYRAVRYQSLASRGFLVAGNFPRLTPESLADQGLADKITQVRYNIDLSDTTKLDSPLLTAAAIATAVSKFST